MPLTLEKLSEAIDQTNTYLPYIQNEIFEKYQDAHVNINGHKIRLHVYGEFSTSLSAAYIKFGEKSDEPYLLVEHEVDHVKFQTKIHNPKIVQYNHFPAPVDIFPHYNAQTIFRSTDNQTRIVAAEGPSTEESSARMLKNMCDQEVKTIFALGSPYDFDAPHFNYYNFEDPKKLSANINGSLCEIIIKTDKVTSLVEDDYIVAYDLIINFITENKTALLKVINIKIKDGKSFEFDDISTLKMIDDEIKNHHVMFHCAAGKGRTSILPLAYMMAEANLFERDNIAEHFVEIFFEATKGRPALAPRPNQLNQMYTYSLLISALRSIPLEQFPKSITNLPEGICRKRMKPFIYTPRITTESTQQVPKRNTFTPLLFPIKRLNLAETNKTHKPDANPGKKL